LSDEALALLWRQPWEGNVRELENVLYKLALCGAGELSTADVEAVAQRFRLRLVARIPPRDAAPALLEAALRTTRNQCGSPNKTRAALYLGWDPDTLARRLAEAGLEAAQLVS
jgi:DNA-binding NtrC family response regulator